MTIGQNIRTWRKQRSLTQNQLGALCGISGASIGSYEKGATIPKRRIVEKIAAALDIPPDKLIGPPSSTASDVQAGGPLLYDGVLAALRELYGAVEGRVILGENGTSKKYYIIQGLSDSFILYENDITAIARSARASISPLVARLNGTERSA